MVKTGVNSISRIKLILEIIYTDGLILIKNMAKYKIRKYSRESFFSEFPQELNSCKIAAITGPMAAGKNYICSLMEKKCFVSIDADIVVHEAIKEATPEILSVFSKEAEEKGIKLTNDDNSLNRRELGKLLFSDKVLLEKQENIVYPYVTKIINNFIRENKDKNVLINATVLYKTTELMEKCSFIIYVTAPFFTRIKRAKKRDNMAYSQILRRFYNQKDLLKKYENSGKEIFLINNK